MEKSAEKGKNVVTSASQVLSRWNSTCAAAGMLLRQAPPAPRRSPGPALSFVCIFGH